MVKWTNEQLLAINEKGENILVAAAAGSGKTAVLVERIINKIINDKIDINKILVVTFTKAAAAEMRGRILDAIYKKIEEDPDDANLQRQVTLLSKASICTIDSFCLDVVKNNFFEIGISPNLKIADNTEIEILKQDTLEDLFEEKYEGKDEEFLKIVNMYTSYKGDDSLKSLILNIHNFTQSTPYPKKWLEEKVSMYEDIADSFEKTPWGEIIFNKIKEVAEGGILRLEEEIELIKFEEYTEKFVAMLAEDIRMLKGIQSSNTWDEMSEKMRNIKFDRAPSEKKIDKELKDSIGKVRSAVKKDITKYSDGGSIIYRTEELTNEMNAMYDILKIIKDLTLEFADRFAQAKLDKNIMDFNDIEHFALQILTQNDGDNHVTKKYMDKYEEILIDEYQDSNLVQESILTSISRGNNIFMVGDVKQSIYKFRGARPELFIEKYNKYKTKDKLSDEDDLKIQLFKNFRSRKNVLDITNIIFDNIMSRELGDIDYTEEEYLNLGADYPEEDTFKAELDIIDLKEEEETIFKQEDEQEEDFTDDDDDEQIENIVLQAKFTAKRIKELVDSGFEVTTKDKTKRKITYKDIALLLLTTKNAAPIYEQELSELGIPVFSDTSAGYLDSVEIQVMLSLLKIIDNPVNDIALVTVLRSMIGGFTDNDLIEIRMENQKADFYRAMCTYIKKEDANEKLKDKIIKFFDMVKKYRNMQEYTPLNELIWQIYLDTGYYSYVSLMPNGVLRVSNLKMLFEKAKQYEKTSFKGLYNFINFIDKLKLSSKDMSGAKLIGENEDVVRIMSIHKSKGLEFPVVFVCNMEKRFNMTDIYKATVMLHQDLGIGAKYVNYDEGESYNTVVQEAMKIKSKNEMLSEEMRVLYVALTRAKEKLIMTGIEKDYEKSIKDKNELLKSYKGDKIDKGITERYITYLDWIELVSLKHEKEISNIMETNVIKKKDVLKGISDSEDEEEFNLREKLDNMEVKDIDEIREKLEWEYDYKITKSILTKSSVTKIKQMKMDLEEPEREPEYAVPKFLEEDKELTGAQKGTIMHMMFSKLDEHIDYDIDKINELIEKLVGSGIINEKEKKAIDVNKLYNFTKSNIWKELQNAKEVQREKPFYMSVKASEIYDEDVDENVLVQGVIDLYYVTADEKLVLVDYKTDKVKDESELVDKYKEQLELYKEALEKATGRGVDRVSIYSVQLDKEINIG